MTIAVTTPMASQAAIFGADGVLVDSPDARAWQEALHELMEGGAVHAGCMSAATNIAPEP